MSSSHQQSDPFSRNKPAGKRKGEKGSEEWAGRGGEGVVEGEKGSERKEKERDGEWKGN